MSTNKTITLTPEEFNLLGRSLFHYKAYLENQNEKNDDPVNLHSSINFLLKQELEKVEALHKKIL